MKLDSWTAVGQKRRSDLNPLPGASPSRAVAVNTPEASDRARGEVVVSEAARTDHEPMAVHYG